MRGAGELGSRSGGTPAAPDARRTAIPSNTRQILPAALAAATAVVADRLSWHLATVAGLVLAALMMPVARMASTRLTLALIGGSATASVLYLSGARIDGAWITPLAALLVVVAGWIVVRRQGHAMWWPRVDLGDGLILSAGLGLVAVLALPLRGIGSEGVLLDLGRGFDNLIHLSMFMDAVGGTESPATSGYPRGFHMLLLLIGGGSLEGSSAEALVPAFALLSVALTAAAAAVCGWTAVGVAGALGDGRHAHVRRAVAGLIYSLFVVLGGLYSGIFEVGHVAFLVPTAVVVGASWLSLRSGARSTSLVVLGTATVAVLGSYPPLIAGLLPATVSCSWALSRRGGSRPWLAPVLLLFLLLVAAVGILERWAGRFGALAADTGEVSTPVASVLLYAVLGIGIAWTAVRSGLRLPVGVWGPVVGFGSLGAAFAVVAAAGGTSLVESYYVEKSFQAAWVGGSVFVFGVGAALIVGYWTSSRSSVPVRSLIAVGALTLLLGGVLLVPEGRYWSVDGAVPSLEMLERRMAEAEAAQDRLHVLAIATALGSDPDEVVVLADPQGWLLPFVRDDERRRPSTATWAVNIVRGPLTTASALMAGCLEGHPDAPGTEDCAYTLVARYPDLKVTIVVEDPSQALLAEDRLETDSRIRVARLSEILKGQAHST